MGEADLLFTPHSMDSHQHAALSRLFIARRLDPSVPEHAVFIAGELAKLKIINSHDYETYNDFYTKRMEARNEAIKAEEKILKDQEDEKRNAIVEEPEVVTETLSVPEVVEEKTEEVVDKPKGKRGRPSKSFTK